MLNVLSIIAGLCLLLSGIIGVVRSKEEPTPKPEDKAMVKQEVGDGYRRTVVMYGDPQPRFVEAIDQTGKPIGVYDKHFGQLYTSPTNPHDSAR